MRRRRSRRRTEHGGRRRGEPGRRAGRAETRTGGAAKDQAAKAPDLRVDQRSIVYTGSITVRVDDVNAAAARAIGIAGAAGGFVGSDNRNSGTGSDDASLTLRVPADKFAAVVDQLAALGEEEVRGISTEDVTEETIDLDARITVQQARVDSGRRLLANAKSLNDLVMLENEVASRESDLASLQAKKRRLADLTALSTITVVLLDPDADLAAGDDGPPGFLAGLQGRLGRPARLAGRAGHRAGRGAALADGLRPADLGRHLAVPALHPAPPGPGPRAPAYVAAGPPLSTTQPRSAPPAQPPAQPNASAAPGRPDARRKVGTAQPGSADGTSNAYAQSPSCEPDRVADCSSTSNQQAEP